MPSFFHGFAIGLSIAAPVGPIGLLCIRRAIAEGRVAGICVGLGAASADAVYGLVAILGLTAITRTLLAYQVAIQTIGGLFLVFLGCSIGQSDAAGPARIAADHERPNLFAAYVSTFVLTLANPTTILSFIGIFAGLGLGSNQTGKFSAAFFIGGVFLGSAAWWILLSSCASAVGQRLQLPHLRWINRAAGALLAGIGACQLAALWLKR